MLHRHKHLVLKLVVITPLKVLLVAVSYGHKEHIDLFNCVTIHNIWLSISSNNY